MIPPLFGKQEVGILTGQKTGQSLQILRDRVLSGRYRIPFFMSTGIINSVNINNIVDLID
jgi:hypothetical protein